MAVENTQKSLTSSLYVPAKGVSPNEFCPPSAAGNVSKISRTPLMLYIVLQDVRVDSYICCKSYIQEKKM